jgi:RNA polymerase sigma-70 factor, ECF subfamily
MMTPTFCGTYASLAAITKRMSEGIDCGEPSDADLVRRTADGDRDAFAHIYRKYQATIFRFARLMIGCNTAAEDIVQEVFLALMRDASNYSPDRASLSTYLYGVARNQTRRRLSRERRFVALDGPERRNHIERAGHDDLDAELSRRGTLQQLRRAILALPSRYREVIVLCDLQDVTYSEAAATLDCPIGTVRSRLHRARQLLSDKLGRRRTGDESSDKSRVTASVRMRCAV